MRRVAIFIILMLLFVSYADAAQNWEFDAYDFNATGQGNIPGWNFIDGSAGEWTSYRLSTGGYEYPVCSLRKYETSFSGSPDYWSIVESDSFESTGEIGYMHLFESVDAPDDGSVYIEVLNVNNVTIARVNLTGDGSQQNTTLVPGLPGFGSIVDLIYFNNSYGPFRIRLVDNCTTGFPAYPDGCGFVSVDHIVLSLSVTWPTSVFVWPRDRSGVDMNYPNFDFEYAYINSSGGTDSTVYGFGPQFPGWHPQNQVMGEHSGWLDSFGMAQKTGACGYSSDSGDSAQSGDWFLSSTIGTGTDGRDPGEIRSLYFNLNSSIQQWGTWVYTTCDDVELWCLNKTALPYGEVWGYVAYHDNCGAGWSAGSTVLGATIANNSDCFITITDEVSSDSFRLDNITFLADGQDVTDSILGSQVLTGPEYGKSYAEGVVVNFTWYNNMYQVESCNVTLWDDTNGTVIMQNQTMTPYKNWKILNALTLSPPDGHYDWNVICRDIYGHQVMSSVNRSLIIIASTVDIVSPVDDVVVTSPNQTFVFETEGEEATSCFFYNDFDGTWGQKDSCVGCNNFTVTSIATGENTWEVQCGVRDYEANLNFEYDFGSSDPRGWNNITGVWNTDLEITDTPDKEHPPEGIGYYSSIYAVNHVSVARSDEMFMPSDLWDFRLYYEGGGSFVVRNCTDDGVLLNHTFDAPGLTTYTLTAWPYAGTCVTFELQDYNYNDAGEKGFYMDNITLVNSTSGKIYPQTYPLASSGNKTIYMSDEPIIDITTPSDAARRSDTPVFFDYYLYNISGISSCQLYDNSYGTWSSRLTNSSEILISDDKAGSIVDINHNSAPTAIIVNDSRSIGQEVVLPNINLTEVNVNISRTGSSSGFVWIDVYSGASGSRVYQFSSYDNITVDDLSTSYGVKTISFRGQGLSAGTYYFELATSRLDESNDHILIDSADWEYASGSAYLNQDTIISSEDLVMEIIGREDYYRNTFTVSSFGSNSFTWGVRCDVNPTFWSENSTLLIGDAVPTNETELWWNIESIQQPGLAMFVQYDLLEGFGRTENCTIYLEYNETENFEVEVPCESSGESIYFTSPGPWSAELRGYDTIGFVTKAQSMGNDFYFEKTQCTSDDDCTAFQFCADTPSATNYCEYKYQLNARVDPDDSILFYWKAWVGTGAGVGDNTTYSPAQQYFLVYVDEIDYGATSYEFGNTTAVFDVSTVVSADQNLTGFDVNWPYVYTVTRNNTMCTIMDCNDTWVRKWLVTGISSASEEWVYGYRNRLKTAQQDYLHRSELGDNRINVYDKGIVEVSGVIHGKYIKLSDVDGTIVDSKLDDTLSQQQEYEQINSPFSVSGCLPSWPGGGLIGNSRVHIAINCYSGCILYVGNADAGYSGTYAFGVSPLMITTGCQFDGETCIPCTTCGGHGNAVIWGVEEDYDNDAGYIYTSCSDLTSDKSYVFRQSLINWPATSLVSDTLLSFNTDEDGYNVRQIAMSGGDIYGIIGQRDGYDIINYKPIIYLLEETDSAMSIGNFTASASGMQIPTLNVIPTIESDYGVFANGTCSADNRYCPWYGYYRYHADQPFDTGRAVRAKGYLVTSESPINDIGDHEDWENGTMGSSWGLLGMTDMVFLTPDQVSDNTGIDMHASEEIVKDSTSPWFLGESINISWNKYEDWNPNWDWCVDIDNINFAFGGGGQVNAPVTSEICSSYQLHVSTYDETGELIDYNRDMLLNSDNAEEQFYNGLIMYSGDNRSSVFREPPSPGHFQVPDLKANYTYEIIVTINTFKYLGGGMFAPYSISDSENITIQGCSSYHYPRYCPDDQGYVCVTNLSGFPVCEQPGDYAIWADQLDYGVTGDNFRINLTTRWAENESLLSDTCPNGEEVQIIYLRAPWTSGVPPSRFTELAIQNGSSYIDYIPRIDPNSPTHKNVGNKWRYRAMVYCGPMGYARTDFTLEECYNDTHCPSSYFCKTWPNAPDPNWAAQCIPAYGNETICYRSHECIGGNCTANDDNNGILDYPSSSPGEIGGYQTSGFCFGGQLTCDMTINLSCPGNLSCQPRYKGQATDDGICVDYLIPGDDCLLDPPEGKLTEITHACTEYWDHTLPEGYDDDRNYMGMTAWCDPTLVCVITAYGNGDYSGSCQGDDSDFRYEPGLCGVGQRGEAARCEVNEYCERNASNNNKPTCYPQKSLGKRCENDYQCGTKQCMGINDPPCDRICYTCEAECLDYGGITCNWDATEDPQPAAYEGYCNVLTERCSGDICTPRLGICDSYYTEGAIDDTTCPECTDSSDCEIGLECRYEDDINRKGCFLPELFCNGHDDCNLFTEFCNLGLPEDDYLGSCVPKRDDGEPCLYKNVNTIEMCQLGEYCEDGVCVGNNPAEAKLGYVTNIKKEGDTCFTAQGPEGWEENDYFIMSDDEQFGTCSYIACDADSTLHNSGASDDDTSCADIVGDRAPAFVFCVGEPDLVNIISGANNILESNVYKYETVKGIQHGVNGYCMWKSDVGETCYGDVQCISGECVGERSSGSGELGYECDCNATACSNCTGGAHIYTPRVPETYLLEIPREAMGLECYCNTTTCDISEYYNCTSVGSDPWFAAYPDNISEYQGLILWKTGINCTLPNGNDMNNSDNMTGYLEECMYYGDSRCSISDIFNDPDGTGRIFMYGNPNCGYPWNQSNYDDKLTDVWNVTYVAPGKCIGIPCDANWNEGAGDERTCPSKTPTCNINTNYCEPAVIQLEVRPVNDIVLSRDAPGDFFQSCAHENDGIYNIDTNGVPLILTWEADHSSGVTRSGDISTEPVINAVEQIDLCEFLSTEANGDDDSDHVIVPLVIKGLDVKTMKTHESRVYDIRVVENEFNFRFVDCRYESDVDEPYCNVSKNDGDTYCSSGYEIIIRSDAPLQECKVRIGKDNKNWSEKRIVYFTDGDADDDSANGYNLHGTGRLGQCSYLGVLRGNANSYLASRYVAAIWNVTEYSYITVECTDDLNVSVRKTYARNPVQFATSYRFTPEQQIFLMLMVLLLIPSLILLFARGRSGF